MPRIRTIKPEMPRDKKLAGLSRDARLTFVYLMTQADDEGFVSGEPRELLASLYPHDTDVSEELLESWISGELVSAGVVEVLEGKDGRVIRLVKWKEHQRIDHPTPSRLAKGSRATREPLAKAGRVDLGPRTNTTTLSPQKPRWPVEAGQDWTDATGGIPAYGKIGKHLKPLVDTHGWPAVRPAWKAYLARTEPQFRGAARFAETYGQWAGHDSGPVPRERAAELIRAAGLNPPEKMPVEFSSRNAIERLIEQLRVKGAA